MTTSPTDYNNLIKIQQKKLAGVSSTGTPSEYEVQQDKQLRQLQAKRATIESEAIKKRWYGTSTAEPQEKPEGFIQRGLNILNAPIYAEVGALEAMTGKGTKKGLANIYENIKEKETFGDYLRKSGVNNAVSAPLGFAMDVAFDPLNWMTMGTTAFIPKVGVGLVKGGAKGLEKGVVSGVLSKAATVGKYTPFFRKTGLQQGLTKVARKTAAEYNEAIGFDLLTKLENQSSKLKLGEIVTDKMKQNKVGNWMVEKFGYSSINKSKEVAKLSETRRAAEAAGEVGTVGADGVTAVRLPRNIDQEMINDADFLEGIFNGKINTKVSPKEWQGMMRSRQIDKGLKMGTDETLIKGLGNIGPDDTYKALVNEKNVDDGMRMTNNADLRAVPEVYSQAVSGAKELDNTGTGFKAYDELMNKLTKSPYIGKAISAFNDYYAGFAIPAFKLAKVPLNFMASHTLAMVGNITMSLTKGFNSLSPEYADWTQKCFRFINGIMMSPEDFSAFAKRINSNPEMREFLSQYPELFERSTGVSSKLLSQNKGMAQLDAINKMIKGDDLEKILKEAGPEEAAEIRKFVGMNTKDLVAQAKILKNQRDLTRISKTAKGLPNKETTFFNQELYGKKFDDVRDYIAKQAEKGGKGWQAFDWMVNKSPDLYGSYDQSFKLGHAMKAVIDGVSEAEVRKIARIHKFEPGTLRFDKATGMYKMSPKKAIEVVNDTFMDYSALPAATKFLRSTPFLGSPFASFTYAMMFKTMKTLKNDPAAFNKINNALHEFQGNKSPLERQALDSKYYSWYKQNGMVRLPFFKDNPIYLNMENMIPYYTLNMFQPSDRTKITEKFPAAVAGIMDKLPFLKDPAGQTLFDYFILPALIKDSQPYGMFNQPLYPEDASAVEKVLYAARNLGEAFVPGVAGYAGIAGGIVAPGIAEYMPSYRYRQLSRAAEGKNALGIKSNESPEALRQKILFGMLGLPYYKMSLKYTDNK